MKTQVVIVAFAMLLMEVRISVGLTCGLQPQMCNDSQSTTCNAMNMSCISVTGTACVPNPGEF